VLGFINGYGTARTFDLRDNRPFISYDYYLDVARPSRKPPPISRTHPA